MTQETLEHRLKVLLVEELNLADTSADEIEDDASLFGEGLGLDSLDAVELVVLLKKHFSIEIKNMDEGREAFQTVRSLADYVRARQGQP